jgi:hypothetical protein
MTDKLFSALEVWREIRDFPGYSVSNHGRFMNDQRGTMLTITLNTHGSWIVGLMKNNIQHKRSVALLVATEFVPKPSNIMYKGFDTPIHLNGDVADNHHTNLTWRPLWFARKYKQQFCDNHQTFDYPIVDVETHITYENSWSAAIHHGLLDHDICESMNHNTYVWPTGQIFREVI